MWLPTVTQGYIELHVVTYRYAGLQVVTYSYKWLPTVTSGYLQLHRVTGRGEMHTQVPATKKGKNYSSQTPKIHHIEKSPSLFVMSLLLLKYGFSSLHLNCSSI